MLIRPPKGVVTLYLRTRPYDRITCMVMASGPKVVRVLPIGDTKTRLIPTADIGAWSKEMS